MVINIIFVFKAVFFISHFLFGCVLLWKPSTTIIYAEFYNCIKWACARMNNTWYECSSSFYNKNHRPFFTYSKQIISIKFYECFELRRWQINFLIISIVVICSFNDFGNECSKQLNFVLSQFCIQYLMLVYECEFISRLRMQFI